MRSTNIAQLREGLAYYVAPSLNFLFADVEGNFGYQCAGKIPKRQMTHTGKYPVHSNSTLHWQGYHVFEHSPYLLNPNQGFIASANNKVISSQFPLMITNDFDWEDPFRAMRIKEMLTSQSLLSLDDMVAMQKDQKSLVFEGMKPAISKLDTTKLSPLGQLWREHLLKWDGVEDLPSVDATVFQTWFLQLQKVTQPETGFDTWDHPMYFIKVFAGNSSEISAQDLALCKKSAVDCDDFALQAFEAALNSLPKNIPGNFQKV